MYFVVWRGYGLFGILPLVLGLITIGFLSDRSFLAASLGSGLVIAATGAALAVTGWWLNRNGNHHSLYHLPLWGWGVANAALGLGVAVWVSYSVRASGWGT